MIIRISIALFILTACRENSSKPFKTEHQKTADSALNNLNYDAGKRSSSRLFPDKLRNLPNEIVAAHYPNPCYATFEDSMYIWKHNTTITAKEDLQIVEYGSFVYTEKGWYLRVTMLAADFEKYYNCKDGLLKKGVTYTDNASWRRSQKLTGGDAMWYYIARDKNGRLVKGTAAIETEGKLINSTVREATVTQSSIVWTGYGEIGNYSLTGNIKLKDAEIGMDANNVVSALINMDMSSISHDQKQLEDHLKDKDFFDVGKFPIATFETESIQYKNPGLAIAKGYLRIKGITKPISIPLQIIKAGNNTLLKSKISIDRTLFGIKYNSKSFFGDVGDQAIKNKFDLAFEMKIM